MLSWRGPSRIIKSNSGQPRNPTLISGLIARSLGHTQDFDWGCQSVWALQRAFSSHTQELKSPQTAPPQCWWFWIHDGPKPISATPSQSSFTDGPGPDRQFEKFHKFPLWTALVSQMCQEMCYKCKASMLKPNARCAWPSKQVAYQTLFHPFSGFWDETFLRWLRWPSRY